MPKTSCEKFPLNEKVKILNLIRNERKLHSEVAKNLLKIYKLVKKK
jgi:hypothetical protein